MVVTRSQFFVDVLVGSFCVYSTKLKPVRYIMNTEIKKKKRKKKKGKSVLDKALNRIYKIKEPKYLQLQKHNDLWKPSPDEIPAKTSFDHKPSVKVTHGKNKNRRSKVSGLTDKSFYTSDEWRALRVRVLEKYECKCMMCGESPKKHGIVIHVDHIKPRSKFPHLALEFNNLQLLCAACNIGKSNKYQTDWRP